MCINWYLSHCEHGILLLCCPLKANKNCLPTKFLIFLSNVRKLLSSAGRIVPDGSTSLKISTIVLWWTITDVLIFCKYMHFYGKIYTMYHHWKVLERSKQKTYLLHEIFAKKRLERFLLSLYLILCSKVRNAKWDIVKGLTMGFPSREIYIYILDKKS